MGIYSPKKRLAKLNWLKENNVLDNMTPLQIQKFLFFTEMFNKNTGAEYDLNKLRAYRNGPVFSDTYGDMKHSRPELHETLEQHEEDFSDLENSNLEKAAFISLSHTDDELSEITHQMDLWKSKAERIAKNELQIPITDEDITNRDMSRINSIYKFADDISDYSINRINDKVFLFNEEDSNLLTEDMIQTLDLLSADENLINPVYVSVEDGVMIID